MVFRSEKDMKIKIKIMDMAFVRVVREVSVRTMRRNSTRQYQSCAVVCQMRIKSSLMAMTGTLKKASYGRHWMTRY